VLHPSENAIQPSNEQDASNQPFQAPWPSDQPATITSTDQTGSNHPEPEHLNSNLASQSQPQSEKEQNDTPPVQIQQTEADNAAKSLAIDSSTASDAKNEFEGTQDQDHAMHFDLDAPPPDDPSPTDHDEDDSFMELKPVEDDSFMELKPVTPQPDGIETSSPKSEEKKYAELKSSFDHQGAGDNSLGTSKIPDSPDSELSDLDALLDSHLEEETDTKKRVSKSRTKETEPEEQKEDLSDIDALLDSHLEEDSGEKQMTSKESKKKDAELEMNVGGTKKRAKEEEDEILRDFNEMLLSGQTFKIQSLSSSPKAGEKDTVREPSQSPIRRGQKDHARARRRRRTRSSSMTGSPSPLSDHDRKPFSDQDSERKPPPLSGRHSRHSHPHRGERSRSRSGGRSPGRERAREREKDHPSRAKRRSGRRDRERDGDRDREYLSRELASSSRRGPSPLTFDYHRRHSEGGAASRDRPWPRPWEQPGEGAQARVPSSC